MNINEIKLFNFWMFRSNAHINNLFYIIIMNIFENEGLYLKKITRGK